MILLIAMAVLGAWAPSVWKRFQAKRRQEELARQLRQALASMSHALRVGVSFQQALAYAAQEGEEPLSGHWRRVLHAVQVGQPLAEALADLAERVPLSAMRWFVAAVQITQSTGGSLADVLATLAESLQDRETLRDKVAALTAQGKVSGILLSALPFLVMGVLWLIVPEMAGPMFTTMKGQALLSAVMLLVAMGGAIIYKIVTIEVDS